MIDLFDNTRFKSSCTVNGLTMVVEHGARRFSAVMPFLTAPVW